MSNITYEILYTPNIPIKQEPFEYIKGEGTFKIYFEPSVGNSITDFNSGFIRIKNSTTEKNVLVSQFRENVIPFTNPFGKDNDIIVKNDILMPKLQKSDEGYYVELPKIVFGKKLQNTTTDVKNMIMNTKLNVQVAITKDVIAAGDISEKDHIWAPNTDDSGFGFLAKYNKTEQKFEKFDLTDYFKGNLLAKGISTWSSPSILYILTETKYELICPDDQKTLRSITSPITEFVGMKKEKNPANVTGLNLKKYKITILNAEDESLPIVDSSGWVSGDGNSELQIKWQNKQELHDKHNYKVVLTICNNFDFIKNFEYELKTSFQFSAFSGNLSLECDHDYARNKIKLNIKSPLVWGPQDNIELTDDDKKDSVIGIKDHIEIQNGISLIPTKGELSAEFIMKGITPLKDWKENGDYILRLQTPDPTIKDPYQTMYSLYALSMPTSFDVNFNRDIKELSPYEEDIFWNPVMAAYDNNKINFKLFLDSSDTKYDTEFDSDDIEDNRVLSLGTSQTEQQTNLDILYVREFDLINYKFLNDSWWEVMIDSKGKVSVQKAPIGIDKIDIKPVHLYDPIKHLITEMGVAVYRDSKGYEKPRIFFDDQLRGFIPGRSKRPTYINEFRLVKQVFGMEAGTKREIFKQTYRSFLTGPNQKLMNWSLIDPNRKYYFHINEKGGQIQLSVCDLTNDGKEHFDRYSAMNTEAEIGLLSDQILNMRGMDGTTYMIQRYSDGRPRLYNLSVDALGIPNVDPMYLSSITIEYEPLLEKDLGIINVTEDKEDDQIQFDEIIADIVINDEVVAEDYQFKCVNEEYYQTALTYLVERIKKEKYHEDDKVILFDTDIHLQYNTFRSNGDIEKLLPIQTDSINLLSELTYMLDIEAIILGGDLVDGSGLTTYDTKDAMKTIHDILEKRNQKTPYMFAVGNHDLNGFFARDSARSRKENKKNGEPKPLNQIVMYPNEMVEIFKDNRVTYTDGGYGYMILNDILYITLNTSDSDYEVVKEKDKYYFKNNTFMSQCVSVKQLNWLCDLLKEKGNKVKNIIICSHIPFAKSGDDIFDYDYHKKGQYKVLNMKKLREIVKNYNVDSVVNKFEENELGQAYEVAGAVKLTDDYAPIQLVLNGHCHTDEILETGYSNIFMSRNALNVVRDKIDDPQRDDLIDGGLGYTYRFSGLSDQRTTFKVIIFSEKERKIKVLNFGYRQNKKLIDNQEFDFKTRHLMSPINKGE